MSFERPNRLEQRRCEPCEGGVPKLPEAAVQDLLGQLRGGWTARNGKLNKVYDFKNFVEAMAFVDRMAQVAEAESHHPDFCVHYSRVIVFIWTHAIAGLSENDFILAAKIDALPR
jgi:4a-hydroxytetrahydrobiopterin dehydratase